MYNIPGFNRTERNKNTHGLAAVCRRSSKRYDGTCKISIEEGQFEISICIPAMQSVQLNTKSDLIKQIECRTGDGHVIVFIIEKD